MTKQHLIISSITGFFWSLAIFQDPFFILLFTASFVLVIYSIIMTIINHRRDMELKKTIESIYVVALKMDGTKIDIPIQFNHLVRHVKAKYIDKEAKRIRRELSRVGNPFFDPDLEPEKQIYVVPIYPNDGVHVNQTDIEYNLMALDNIKDFRAKWHKLLKETDLEWYKKYHHHQV